MKKTACISLLILSVSSIALANNTSKQDLAFINSDVTVATNVHFNEVYCTECHLQRPKKGNAINLRYKNYTQTCRCHGYTPDTYPEGNAGNSFLRLEVAPRPVLCGNCHGIKAGTKAYVEKTDHDLAVTAPKAKNILGQTPVESGVCGACHIIHNEKNKIRLWGRDYGNGKGVMDRMCNGCHSEAGSGSSKLPKVSTHPEKQLIANPGRNTRGKENYFPLFDNASGAAKTVGDIACASCHDVHQWDPKQPVPGTGNNLEGKATTSFLRMQTYNMIYKDCHGLDSLFRFKYYHDARKRKPR